ncbi:gtr1 g protein gtr2 [Lentinula edodes]|uniref:GTP-binding protein n=1 Tax=Lentinula edodes TaxID=5353 RepID=A0A1Q3ES65_LENED|nr:gtr1 g protein gtr2 [Lentinula edodes]
MSKQSHYNWNITVETLGVPLSVFSTLVFVIDIRDLYNQPISRLVEFIIAAYHHNPSLNLEIFVHKAEKLQEDEKIENFRQINERLQLRWQDFIEQQLLMNFYLTSIFDHSLHQAFSKVLQRLTDSLPYLEELLNIYCANSQASKVFLFDAPSRLYVASDASPVDTATYNLCCDNLAMINAFGTGLYRSVSASPCQWRIIDVRDVAFTDIHTSHTVQKVYGSIRKVNIINGHILSLCFDVVSRSAKYIYISINRNNYEDVAPST